MNTLDFILNKFGLTLQPDTEHRGNAQRMPFDVNLSRDGLACLFNELGFKQGAEIGVESGAYSEVLCKGNPELRLHAVDAWKAYRGYRDHVSQEKIDGFYEAAKARVAEFNCELLKGFSIEIAKQFKDESLDFVYIDGNHGFEWVVNDLAAWCRKVRVGGIISGHDYFLSKNGAPFHVPYAVKGWTEAYRIKPWFVLRGDHTPSWMWVKQ